MSKLDTDTFSPSERDDLRLRGSDQEKCLLRLLEAAEASKKIAERRARSAERRAERLLQHMISENKIKEQS